MRGLPACERQAYVESLDDVVDDFATHLKRSFKFKNATENVPFTACDISYSGLGYDFYLSIYAGDVLLRLLDDTGVVWKAYIEQKHQT